MVHLTKRLRDLREDHDLTQKELAKVLNVPPQRVSEWELGIYEPRLDTLIELANYYQVTLDYLVGRT